MIKRNNMNDTISTHTLLAICFYTSYILLAVTLYLFRQSKTALSTDTTRVFWPLTVYLFTFWWTVKSIRIKRCCFAVTVPDGLLCGSRRGGRGKEGLAVVLPRGERGRLPVHRRREPWRGGGRGHGVGQRARKQPAANVNHQQHVKIASSYVPVTFHDHNAGESKYRQVV